METPDDRTGPADDVDLDGWMAYAPEPQPEPRPRPKLDALAYLAIAGAILTIVGMIALRPTGESRRDAERLVALGIPSQFHEATVVAAEEGPCQGLPSETCVRVEMELTSGPDVGYVFVQEYTTGRSIPDFAAGQTVVLSYLRPTTTVVDAADVPCSFDPEQVCRTLTLLIDDGETGRYVDYELFPGDFAETLLPGDMAVIEFFQDESEELEILAVAPVDPSILYQFADFQRRPLLIALALLFAVVVIALGRMRGVAALAGLIASVMVLLLFVLPAILDGRSPVLVAVVGASAIAYLALYLAHGFSRMTTVALLGTLSALILTALLSAVVVALANFTGVATEESSFLTLFGSIDVRGLLLAGIVLGAAGAIDDVTVTQASAVWELKAASPSLTQGRLFSGGLKIGRDHIASTVNTLLLAYAGAALPLLVLFVLAQQSLGSIANSEIVAVEIVRTLVGSIGLVAAVPITTWLAARTASGNNGGHAHP